MVGFIVVLPTLNHHETRGLARLKACTCCKSTWRHRRKIWHRAAAEVRGGRRSSSSSSSSGCSRRACVTNSRTSSCLSLLSFPPYLSSPPSQVCREGSLKHCVAIGSPTKAIPFLRSPFFAILFFTWIGYSFFTSTTPCVDVRSK